MYPLYDLVGVGFGPANLSICIALHESVEAKAKGFSMVFLEKQPHFSWHHSLLLPGTKLQVSPMKDLVTMRDPTSYYSFTNYLHVHGRLAAYINRASSVPSRREWSAYLSWAAALMQQYTRYAHQVQSIKPVHGADGKVAFVQVIASDAQGTLHTFGARNVCIAVGGQANISAALSGIAASPRVVHSAQFLPEFKVLEPELRAKEQPRLCVLGSGQSAAEMLLFLHSHFPNAHIDMVFRASALVPSDDTPYVNSAAFDPASSQGFWELPASLRAQHLAEFRRTNYSVVNKNLISEIYEQAYEERIGLDGEAAPRLHLKPNTLVLHAEENEGKVVMYTRVMQATEPVSTAYDAVFLGTGFVRAASCIPFVEPLRPHFSLLSTAGVQRLIDTEEAFDGALSIAADKEAERARMRGITRDYFLVPDEPNVWTPTAETVASVPQSLLADAERPDDVRSRTVAPRVLVLGSNEATHGFSDSLLSLAAYRAGLIANALLAGTPAT